jgi:hypothetical protein
VAERDDGGMVEVVALEMNGAVADLVGEEE